MLQLFGGTGQVAPEHATVVFEQELEHVLTIKKFQPMSQKLRRKRATFNNAVMILGQYGVHRIHALIVGPFHLNDAVRGVNSSKHQRVPRRVKFLDRKIIQSFVMMNVPTDQENSFVFQVRCKFL